MNSNIKKRILTSILLIALLIGMFFYSYIMIISLIIIAIISWIEFYALISKIFKKDRFYLNCLTIVFLVGLFTEILQGTNYIKRYFEFAVSRA